MSKAGEKSRKKLNRVLCWATRLNLSPNATIGERRIANYVKELALGWKPVFTSENGDTIEVSEDW